MSVLSGVKGTVVEVFRGTATGLLLNCGESLLCKLVQVRKLPVFGGGVDIEVHN